MSDFLTHECGIAMVRLLKPLDFYIEKYGTAFYGINKMYLLMEKQHNRGQDGAGFASIKLNMPPGKRYISRYRSVNQQPIQDIFTKVNNSISDRLKEETVDRKDGDWLKHNIPFVGEVYLGHLRYGTYGGNSIEACHPFLRQNNWMTRNLVLAGNFNMTNVDELFNELVRLGQHPKEKTDTVTILEKIGHFLDAENEHLYKKFKKQGYPKSEISALISDNLNVSRILKRSAKKWDGGYAMAGMFGHGDSFVLRDPSGIRPAFYYQDDEVVVVASERPVIQTVFNVKKEDINEIPPGNALIIKKNGAIKLKEIRSPYEKRSCSFERIYFSRGSDADIYQERLALGKNLVPQVLKAIDNDIENTVFSFVPNTAEVAFYGLIKGVEDYLDDWRKAWILKNKDSLNEDSLGKIMKLRPRAEKIAWKDIKLRTFITEDSSRNDLVSHIYDVTYGTVKPTDNLVVLDDSIVRGTTLKQSILKILGRLKPKKIIIVSSAPQIRYPDCYGIDMARIGSLIAFEAAEQLHREKGTYEVVFPSVYKDAKAVVEDRSVEKINHVKRIFDPFTADEISKKITELLTPKGMEIEIEILFQKIDGLHQACPNHSGDWYFTGNYPTDGGNRVVNKAFVYYVEGNMNRAY